MGARDGDHSLSELGVARGSGHLLNFVKSQTAKQTKQLKVEEGRGGVGDGGGGVGGGGGGARRLCVLGS